jgi:RNA ligase (TIGR02306 family)
MAFFGVTIEEIEAVWDHPNADRLSMAKCKNLAFQFVTGKNQFNVGDKVLYFPIDSLLPQSICEKLNLKGKLSGKDHNRVKSMKLRNEISQGLVSTISQIIDFDYKELLSEELTKKLGIEKYEPPVIFLSNGNLVKLPESVSVYDIEGADRYQHIIELLLDKEVVISEKMEGTNFSITKEGENLFVNQRNNSIQEIEGSEHSFWNVARKSGLVETIPNLEMKNITVYAELCGPSIQSNIYKLKQQSLFVFDIKENGKFVSFDRFEEILKMLPSNELLQIAPIVFKGKLKDFLNGETIQSKSNGKSILLNIWREGLVIKPLIEDHIQGYGRLIIKQRSPEYLSGSDN